MRRRHSLGALVVLAASCSGGGGGGSTQPANTVASVTMSQSAATLVPQATVQITASPVNSSGTAVAGQAVTWSSSASAVASVSTSGLVTAAAVGTATITATSSGKAGTAAITVLDGGLVGAAGGSVTALSGAVKLTIPAGALAASTALTVAVSTDVPTDPRIIPGAIVEIGPSGTQFGAGATLSLSYDPTKIRAIDRQSDLRLFTKNATTGVWSPLNAAGTGSVDTVAHVVTGPLPHLTEFVAANPIAIQAFSSTTLAGLPGNQVWTNTVTKLSSVSLFTATTNAYGQPVNPVGTPTVTSSAPTIVSVSNVSKGSGTNLGVDFTLTGVITGSANVIVTADGFTITLPLTIAAGPSLSIALSSSSLTTPQGTGATGTAQVNITQNYTAPVTLSAVSISPANVTGTFTPALVPAASSSSALSVGATGFLAPGAYALTVNATSTPPGTTTPLIATATYTVNVTATAGSETFSSADPTRPFVALYSRSTAGGVWATGTCANNACPFTYSPSATALTIALVEQTGVGAYHNFFFNLAGSEVPYLEQFLAGETQPMTTASVPVANVPAGYTFSLLLGSSKASTTASSASLTYPRIRSGYQLEMGFLSSVAGLNKVYPLGQQLITPALTLPQLDLNALAGFAPVTYTVNITDPSGLNGALTATQVFIYREGGAFAEGYSTSIVGPSATVGAVPAAGIPSNQSQGLMIQSTNSDGSYRLAKAFFDTPGNLSLTLGPPVGSLSYSQNSFGSTTLDISHPLQSAYNGYYLVEVKDLTGNFRTDFRSSSLWNAGATTANYKTSDMPSLWNTFNPPNNVQVNLKYSAFGLVGGTINPWTSLRGFVALSAWTAGVGVKYSY